MKIINYIALVFIFFVICIKTIALIEVDITRGNLNPLPIAFHFLKNEKSKKISQNKLKLEDLGQEISKVIENNLRQSGYLIH